MRPAPRSLRPLRRLAALVAAGLAAAAPAAQPPSLTLTTPFPNVTVNAPTDFQHAPDGSGLLFVTERTGRVRVFPNSPAATASTFLDLTGVLTSSWLEHGLLGLAFHPDYAANRYLYVDYVRTGTGGGYQVVVARYTRDAANPLLADPASAQVMAVFTNPTQNHVGGQLAFGPPEGPGGRRYLYVSVGDGGPEGDTNGNGQNLANIHGSVLRLDVDGGGGPLDCATGAATVPADNPFVGTAGACNEIWAYGLRNPWRMSFDPPTGRLWVGDVGQGAYEEVDTLVAGGNYGWSTMEGAHCYRPTSGCVQTGLRLPVHEYGRSLGGSITGGVVYRGGAIPGLSGYYLFADWVSGRVWALGLGGGTPVVTQVATRTRVMSFGTDAAGEVYLVAGPTTGAGTIERLTAVGAAAGPAPAPPAWTLRLSGANPARGPVELLVGAGGAGTARLTVYDALGRAVAVPFSGPLAANATRAVRFDGNTLAPGVYVAHLAAPGASRTLRFTVAP